MRTGDRMVKLAGEPRPIDPETMNLIGQVDAAAIPVEPIFDGFLQRRKARSSRVVAACTAVISVIVHPSRPPRKPRPKTVSRQINGT